MNRSRLKTPRDIEELRRSGRILAYVLLELRERAAAGVSLSVLDREAQKLLAASGAESAFFGYKPEGAHEAYPAHICTSVNEEVVHGLPDKRILKDGDVLSLDLGVRLGTYVTDGALTVIIGKGTDEARRLVAATEAALSRAVLTCVLGKRLGDVGHAVEKTALKRGFKVIRNLVGHGVGFALHEHPDVYNFGEPGTGEALQEGLVIAIEPMLSPGASRAIQKKDGSFVTEDGSLSAHAEVTVAITASGPEVLTPLYKVS